MSPDEAQPIPRDDDVRPPRRSLGDSLRLAAVLAPPLPAASYLGYKLFGVPFVAFDVFDWMTRVLPGPLITFGIDSMVRILVAFGFNIKDTAKLAEQLQAVFGFLVTGFVFAAAFFYLFRGRSLSRSLALGVFTAELLGLPVLLISLDVYGTASVPRFAGALWILFLFAVWGLALGWAHVRTAPYAWGVPGAPQTEETGTPHETFPETGSPATVSRISRRRFLVEIGGTAAAVTVLGAGVAAYLRLSEEQPELISEPPIPAPNADATVQPVAGTRPEYTPLPEHYRIDINTIPPDIAVENWRLEIRGLVDSPLDLTIDDIRENYEPVQQFVTLGCISNPIAGPLISTTLWTGARLSQVLADAGVQEEAGYVHVTSEDGFYETIPLDLLRSDDRIMLTYEFDAQPLPREHGSPLRVWIPNRYGMKQPKWIVGIELTEDFQPGYWVERGWSREAIINVTSVIDTVATEEVTTTGGRQIVPVGGIAWGGDRSIQRVQVRSDGGPWEDAELRQPLSGATWVLWRYPWPFSPGEHTLEVRAQDGEGNWQVAEESDTYPDGATGLHSYEARVSG